MSVTERGNDASKCLRRCTNGSAPWGPPPVRSLHAASHCYHPRAVPTPTQVPALGRVTDGTSSVSPMTALVRQAVRPRAQPHVEAMGRPDHLHGVEAGRPAPTSPQASWHGPEI